MEDEDLRIVVNRLKFRYAQLEVEILGIYSSTLSSYLFQGYTIDTQMGLFNHIHFPQAFNHRDVDVRTLNILLIDYLMIRQLYQ